MKKFILSTLTILVFINAQPQEVLRDEARKAFEYLNEMRLSPATFSEVVGVGLGYVEPRQALQWSDILARVAEEKALDMAEREYFSHVDPDGNGINFLIKQAGYEIPASWVEEVTNNYFESIQAGASTGTDVINDLVRDEGIDPPGHRNHLLGIENFWSNCPDTGIGMVKKEGSVYGYYTCIIIAKHDF
jgi:uncharacterized protein YkwD